MKRFTKSDLQLLRNMGVSTKGMRAAREVRECVQIFEPPLPEPADETVRWLIRCGVPVTAENWMLLQFAGHPPAVGEVDGEILAELPRWVRSVYDPDYEPEED